MDTNTTIFIREVRRNLFGPGKTASSEVVDKLAASELDRFGDEESRTAWWREIAIAAIIQAAIMTQVAQTTLLDTEQVDDGEGGA
jgi:hypothetical protein